MGGGRTRALGSSGWARKAVAGMVGGATLATTLVVGSPSAGAIVPGPNGRIAFESNRTGNNEIFTMNPDGSALVNVTRHPANDVFPAWSPDGNSDHLQQRPARGRQP